MARNFLEQLKAAVAAQKAQASEPEPVQEPEPELHLEDTRWKPFRPHKKKCSAEQHYPAIGRCEKCGDVFPCPSGNCGHFDCAEAGNGTALPEFLNVISFQDSDNLMARADSGSVNLEIRAPDLSD